MKRLVLGAALALSLCSPAFADAPYAPDANAPRSAVPAPYRWQLEPLLADDAAFEKGLVEAAAGRKRLQACKGTLSDPARLAACLDEYFATRLITNKCTLYANLRLTTDEQNTTLQAMNDRALGAMDALMSQAGFIRGEVLALDEATLADSRLEKYRPYLRELRRRRAHVLSAEGERLLSLAGDNQFAEIDLNEIPSGYEKTFQALLTDLPLPTILDEKGKPVQLTLSNYGKYRASSDRNVRRGAVEGLFGTLQTFRHAFAATLAGQVNFTVFLARARGYDSALAAYLDRDDIDPAVYRNLISAVHQNLGPLHRYISMRKRLMGLEQIRLYDLYTPLVQDVKRDIPYEEARRTLLEALAPLGEGYLAVIRTGLEPANGWVDVYPHKDKDSGASCSTVYGVHPFVKMNYLNEPDDVSTLAHEFGHAVHSDLSMKTQPYPTASYAPFIAEIASTCNEKLLSDYLARTAKTDAERLFVLNEMVDRIRTTLYRQTLFAEFELRIHEAAEKGTPLTAEFLNQTYAGLIQQYYGPDFTVGPDDGIEWAYIPHLYYKFYVFSYATGISSGIALAELIQEGGEPAREAYLDMLRGGNSKPPLDLLKGAGVDLTRPEAINAAARLMDSTLTEMEELLERRAARR